MVSVSCCEVGISLLGLWSYRTLVDRLVSPSLLAYSCSVIGGTTLNKPSCSIPIVVGCEEAAAAVALMLHWSANSSNTVANNRSDATAMAHECVRAGTHAVNLHRHSIVVKAEVNVNMCCEG